MVTDSISDFIIRIKNAGLVNKEEVVMPYSKFRNAVAQKLRITNYINDVKTTGHGTNRNLIVSLMYDTNGKHKVNNVKRISKPGCRIYVPAKDIKSIKNGYGLLVLSTPKGILTGEEAKKEHVGGEILFSIW